MNYYTDKYQLTRVNRTRDMEQSALNLLDHPEFVEKAAPTMVRHLLSKVGAGNPTKISVDHVVKNYRKLGKRALNNASLRSNQLERGTEIEFFYNKNRELIIGVIFYVRGKSYWGGYDDHYTYGSLFKEKKDHESHNDQVVMKY